MMAGGYAFILAAAAIAGLNLWATGRRSPATMISVVLLLLVAATNLSLWALGERNGARLLPLWDATAAVFVASAFITQKTVWKGVIVGVFLAMGAAHGAIWVRDMIPPPVDFDLYLVVLDVLTIVQLAAAAWPGGSHVATLARDGLRRRDVGRRHGGP